MSDTALVKTKVIDRTAVNEDARVIIEFERAVDAWASVRHNIPRASMKARVLKEARDDALLALLSRLNRLRAAKPYTPLQEETAVLFRQNGLQVS